MAYLALIWKARTIEKYRLNYEREKLNSIRIMNAHNPQKTTQSLYQRLCQYNCNTKQRISKTFLRYYPEGSTMYNFCYYLKTDHTFPNFVVKSVIGFTGGIVLTYLCFMFFVFQLAISLFHATIMSSIIGVLLTLGLAFSYRIRCLVFLLIPQLFSRVGRYTLTCYALVLILTGPATNTLKNSEVLSESLACAQEQVKSSMYQINESEKKPLNSMKDSINLMVKGIKELAAKIKKSTMHLHRLTLSLSHSIQSSFSWLNSVSTSCKKNLGSPYERCNQAIKHSMDECQAVLGSWHSRPCNVSSLTNKNCWPIKSLSSFCQVFDYANGNILEVVTKKLNTFSERINSMLYLDVLVHHSYSLNNNASKSANQVAAGIVTEIRNKADLMLTWLSWSSCVTSASLLLIIFRAKYYQQMYETRSRFDNRYVTKELIDLDLKRLRQGRETVLPLNRREEGKYIKTSSFRLVSSESRHLSRSSVTMAITTFKLLIHMVADYSLYWVLMTIRHHGLYQTPLKPNRPGAEPYISGSSLVSRILISLVGSITAPLATPPPSTIACLPNPHPPDFQRYLQIGILIFLLWFFALFEPYGLRLRHVIMGLYRPERAKARAVWLFNHIQRTRGSFIKFARRKLHREYKYISEKKHTFRRWLQARMPCMWLKTFLGIYPDEPHCFLCGIMEECNECDGSLVKCDSQGCPGTYCVKCFSDIGQLCTICLSPVDYGDMSDVSMEKGSSEDSDDDFRAAFDICRQEGTSHQEDDNEGSSKKGLPKKRTWNFFSKKGKGNEDIPLLKHKDGNGKNKPTKERTAILVSFLILLLLCNRKASLIEDDNEASFNKQLKKKQKKAELLRRKEEEGEKEIPLLDNDEENDKSKRNDEKKLRRRDTLVRHRKYAEIDFENKRRKEILSLGLDTKCSIYHDHCEICAINNSINVDFTKLQKSKHYIENDKIDVSLKTASKKLNNSYLDEKGLDLNSKPSKHNLSIDESIEKIKKHFKNMRKYALIRRHSQPILRTRCCNGTHL